MIFPHPLTYDYYPYHIPLISWKNPWAVISVLLYILLIIYALKGIKKKGIISYGIWFYLISLFIVSNILFAVGTFMNERFLFMPSIGFCLIIAYLIIEKLPGIMAGMKPFYVQIPILALIILFSFIKTVSRNRAWKNDFTLFSTDVKTSTGSAKSNCSYGGALIEKANQTKDSILSEKYCETAIIHLKKAIKIHPTYFDAILLLGNAYAHINNPGLKAGQTMLDSSMFYYKQALLLNPGKELVFNNINIVLNGTDSVDFKIKYYEEFYSYNPNHFDFNYKLGYLYGRFKNDLAKSVPYLEKAVKIKPDDFNVNKDLGVAYGLSRNFEKSKIYLEKAIAINPDDRQTYQNLMVTYLNSGETEKAHEVAAKLNQMEK